MFVDKSHARQIIRGLISIGGGLRLEKEFRDIFLDLVRLGFSLVFSVWATAHAALDQMEKIIEPCRKSSWTQIDLDNFLVSIRDKFSA